jgi:serine/threonine protein phosphatase PrpC
MLSRWLDRGLGQLLAPDQKYAEQNPPPDEANASFWHIVAPDPQYESSGGAQKIKRTNSGPPASAFLSSPAPTMPADVRCQHCHKLTPINPSTPVGSTSTPTTETTTFLSPLDKGILDAVYGQAESLLSPASKTNNRRLIFRCCATAKPLQEKMLNKLRSLFMEQPDLLSARSVQLGFVPDGFTPLMACAYVNQVEGAKLILEFDAAALKSQVDPMGRTALHIASDMGSTDVVELLCSSETVGEKAPVDVRGRTPLGAALTSENKSAKKVKTALVERLFSPGDRSIVGLREEIELPRHTLCPLGASQMPGFRVKMEDALSLHAWDQQLLVGVCDGHSDDAQVSQLVAQQVRDVYLTHFTEPNVWIDTCLELDQQVRAAGIKGGSTAVWALVNESTVTVVNVGDCRCILIQQAESLEEKMEKMSLKQDAEESKESESSSGDKTTPTISSIVVMPLSTDHKPDLESEKTRIEQAGLKVFEENFTNEQGLKVTLAKIALTESLNMAVSRSFGDFEYKAKPGLDTAEQAVTALPEVIVHARSPQDMYLLMACDGIWDVMTNEEVADFVAAKVDQAVANDETNVLSGVSYQLLEECLQRGSKDNLSVVLVALTATADKVKASGVLQRKALHFE